MKFVLCENLQRFVKSMYKHILNVVWEDFSLENFKPCANSATRNFRTFLAVSVNWIINGTIENPEKLTQYLPHTKIDYNSQILSEIIREFRLELKKKKLMWGSRKYERRT